MADRELPEDRVAPEHRGVEPLIDGLLTVVDVLQLEFDGLANLYVVAKAEAPTFPGGLGVASRPPAPNRAARLPPPEKETPTTVSCDGGGQMQDVSAPALGRRVTVGDTHAVRTSAHATHSVAKGQRLKKGRTS